MSTPNPQNVDPMECSSVSPECPVEASIYGYYPSLGANAFFTALFALCLVLNLILGVRFRKSYTYTIAMTLACVCAGLGYAGRVMMHSNPFNITGFQIQICCLTLSPAFNSAAIYLTLKHIVRVFGREWSRLRPKYYTWIFITADFLALILQGAGGGIAATAGSDSMLKVGERLMIAGIAWQVLTLLLFGIAATDFIIRRWRASAPLTAKAQDILDGLKFKIYAASLLVIYFAIFIRCVYRIAEMAGGWRNPIMQDEPLFIGVDSALVGLATLLQTTVHPGIFFPALIEGGSKKHKHAQSADAEQTVVEKNLSSGSSSSSLDGNQTV